MLTDCAPQDAGHAGNADLSILLVSIIFSPGAIAKNRSGAAEAQRAVQNTQFCRVGKLRILMSNNISYRTSNHEMALKR
jgi:hypothetical protein